MSEHNEAPERIWIDKDGLRNFRSRGSMHCYPHSYEPPTLSVEYVRADFVDIDPPAAPDERDVHTIHEIISEYADRDNILLSLLDSQVAGPRDLSWALCELADGWIDNNQREGEYGFYRNAQRVLEAVASDVATSMRSACIEKVKAKRDEWESERNRQEPLSKMRNRYDAAFCAANEIIAALQSVTIQEQEKQK